ncbi:hypothetical protein GTO91_12935 [Heliobacterium undosum]|uniref:CRISPR type III-associated protein domain-containing protein n=1 Tax=Heliomicrobium undosum TaxID=121734 RepID=A0A845L5X3_9FIRM|nr:RAMP superfamily CRISPR-associated protein [Heliomicrobium undosum]MZP30619.1 hypothetical protein [Heliomicrobium undosum]
MAKGQYTLLKNKPYTFVPLLSLAASDRKPATPHNRLEESNFSGRLILEMNILSPVHVGSGGYRLVDDQLARAHVRRAANIVIPGSSIKGVVRSLAESASRSCLLALPNRDLGRALPKGMLEECSSRSACISCRIFGLMRGRESYKGKVHFGEFSLQGQQETRVENMPFFERPFKNYPDKRSDAGNERLYYCRVFEQVECGGPEKCPVCTKDEWFTARSKAPKFRSILFRGRKVYLQGPLRKGELPYEVIPEGAVLRGEIVLQNLSHEELSLLIFALGLDGEIRLRVGYGKPAYFGTIQMNILQSAPPDRPYLRPLPKKETLIQMARDYGREIKDKDIQANVRRLREILSGNIAGPQWTAPGY